MPEHQLEPAWKSDMKRAAAITEAMTNYLLGGDIPPDEWVYELNQRLHDAKTRKEREEKPVPTGPITRRR